MWFCVNHISYKKNMVFLGCWIFGWWGSYGIPMDLVPSKHLLPGQHHALRPHGPLRDLGQGKCRCSAEYDDSTRIRRLQKMLLLVCGDWSMTFIFPFSWEFHHPIWRTHIFQRGGSTTNQLLSLLPSHVLIVYGVTKHKKELLCKFALMASPHKTYNLLEFWEKLDVDYVCFFVFNKDKLWMNIHSLSFTMNIH